MNIRLTGFIFLVFLSMTGCLGNKDSYLRNPSGNIRDTVVFLEVTDPENRLQKDQLEKLNSFLASLLGKSQQMKVVRIEVGSLTDDFEGCSSFLPKETLYQIMEKHQAGRIFFGDILSAGDKAAVLFLNSLTSGPGGLKADKRQVLLKHSSTGYWETDIMKPELRSRKDITIMLDPGHGGVDTGAESWFQGHILLEKELNNNLTTLLSRELISRGYKVIYTRSPDNDLFINPEGRSEIINREKPDFLVSIHHDFSEVRADSGFSVYYSSFKPVIESEDAYIMVDGEKREYLSQNSARGGMIIAFRDAYGNETNTREIPWWTDYDPFIHDDSPPMASSESLKLAYLVYGNLRNNGFIEPYHYTEGRIIEDRDYAILRDTKVPAILIETAFVTNQGDMEYLTATDHQILYILSIADSLDTFFNTGEL